MRRAFTEPNSDGSGAAVWTKGQRVVYDGKRVRKPVARKTVDFSAGIIKFLLERNYRRDYRDRSYLIPNLDSVKDIEVPLATKDQPAHGFTSKYIQTSANKARRPVNCVTWTPEGRRLITGSHAGEFTLWNGLQFNFETILQAHAEAIRRLVWTHNDEYMISTDDGGYIKYWQGTMNNVKVFQAHEDSVRDASFCPTDLKFVTASDDHTMKIWDFDTCTAERVLEGHGWDVKSVSWHPYKGLIVSGAKDNLIKLWDPRTGSDISTLVGHKNTVSHVSFNRNGNWFLSGSRDQLVKAWDIRKMDEFQTFRGHQSDVTAMQWHPCFEESFCTGDYEGNVNFWIMGRDQPQAEILSAHDESAIWDLAWHPLGHILATGSNDQTTKFWTRNRPGDEMTDKYNVMMLPPQDRNDAVISLKEAAEFSAGTGRASQLPSRIMRYEVSMENEDEEMDKSNSTQQLPGMGSADRLLQMKGRKTAEPVRRPQSRSESTSGNDSRRRHSPRRRNEQHSRDGTPPGMDSSRWNMIQES